MPKKNSQNKPNGFVIFANEIRNELLREGHVIRSMPDLITAASPKWKNLPADEREYYKDKAKWDWENRNGKVNQFIKKPVRPDRKDCTGSYLDGRVDLVKFNEERRKRERVEVFSSWPCGRAVTERNFYFLSFICLLEEPHFQPIEVAAVEFNLLHGIINSWHKFIIPGPIEMGYQYLAQQISESTHKIPINGIAEPGYTYTSIYDELLQFLSRGTNHIPPIHVKMSDCERVEGCIMWLARMAGRPHQLKRIYELEGLILDLDFHFKGQPQDFFVSKQMGTSLISSTMYDWDSDSKCKYHEENETRFCAKGYVYKYAYTIADYFCKQHDITATAGHCPAVKDEPSYTLIKGNASKERSKSRDVSNKNIIDSDEIARKVAEHLKIEAENRSIEAEMGEMEIDSEKRRLEQKRWLSLRGANNDQATSGIESTNYGESSSKPQHGMQDNQVQRPVFGRGRGRGAANIMYSLRRPGDQSTATTDINGNDKVIYPQFGRGTKMYTGK